MGEVARTFGRRFVIGLLSLWLAMTAALALLAATSVLWPKQGVYDSKRSEFGLLFAMSSFISVLLLAALTAIIGLSRARTQRLADVEEPWVKEVERRATLRS